MSVLRQEIIIMDYSSDRLLHKAFEFAEVSLAGQRRKSGEYFVDHCVRVADILMRYKINDTHSLSAAILHHSLSEGAATRDDIQNEFGSDIAGMVDAFERLRIIRLGEGMDEEFVENLRKMFLVLAKDLRVVLIKLADILDNLTTLRYLSNEKGQRLAKETLEIFAPLSERLGMSEMKGEMQDLAFAYLYPDEYRWVKKMSGTKLQKMGKDLLHVKGKLLTAFQEARIEVVMQSRVKQTYSLYKKLSRVEIDRDISKVHDLMALRIIVNTKEECYQALSIINKLFQPANESVSDYIAHPKSNGYQSIHARFLGPSNTIFEIQIRSKKMHEEAEYGVAAHWHYAEKKTQGAGKEELDQGFKAKVEKLEWVKKLSAWQEEIKDNQEFLKTVKTDLFGERIYVFTPKGDVIDLPEGATPVDFAYRVHTDLGEKMAGAKVNGKMVPLDYKLKNADVVEINESKDKHKKPNRDWLNFVVTDTARKCIKRLNAD